jgi:hypothetical protein
MTIEEKKQALISHCKEADCDACVLKDAECDFNNIEEITTDYDIISTENESSEDQTVTMNDKVRAIEIHCNVTKCSECILRDLEERNNGCYTNPSEEAIDKFYKLVLESNAIKPSYYNDTKITPFDVIDDWELNFYLGNAIKYIKRAGKKANNSRLQDLRKVREYIDHEIKAEEATYGRN